MFSEKVWERQFIYQVFADVGLVLAAILLIFMYANLVLGSCSPIHLRTASASIGIFCVTLAVLSGYGLAFLLG